MKSLATFITGRRTAWIVLAVCLVALGLALALIPRPATTSQANPATAGDSYATAQWLTHVPSADTMNGIVVWTRTDHQPFSSAEQDAVRSPAAAVAKLSPDPKIAWTQVSPDRTAMLVIVPIQTQRVLSDAPAIAKSLLSTARQDLPPGVQAQLTGQIENLADNAQANASTGALPLELGLLVLAALLLIAATRSLVLWLIPLILAGATAFVAELTGAQLATAFGVPINQRDLPIVFATTLAVATAFAALLVLRQRREVAGATDRYEAATRAWLATAQSVVASAVIFVVGALIFLFAGDLRVRMLALAAALGIVIAVLTVLLAVAAGLAVSGSRRLWMSLPASSADSGRPARTWVSFVTAAVLLIVMTGAAGVIIQAGAPAKDTQAAAARTSIDRAFTKGYGNQSIMIVPNSLSGDTSILAPTTLAMNLPDAHAVTVGASYKGFSALTAQFDIDPGSAKSFATLRTLRGLIAEKGDPTATTLVGGQDAAALDRANATATELVTVVPISIVIMLALVLLLDVRARRRSRSNEK